MFDVLGGMCMCEFNEQINCNTCKHGYFAGFSYDGFHNLCGAGRCYLCAQQYEYCNYYEEGTPPEGKEEM